MPLHVAASNGHANLVQLLIKSKAQPDKQTPTGLSALHAACEKGQSGSAAVLLSAGAKVDLKDNDGRTALHISGAFGRGGGLRHQDCAYGDGRDAGIGADAGGCVPRRSTTQLQRPSGLQPLAARCSGDSAAPQQQRWLQQRGLLRRRPLPWPPQGGAKPESPARSRCHSPVPPPAAVAS